MNHIEKFIDEVECKLPKLASTSDLIKLGIFSSIAQAVQCRKRGESPEFLYLSPKRIAYPKQAVMCWLRERASLDINEIHKKNTNNPLGITGKRYDSEEMQHLQ